MGSEEGCEPQVTKVVCGGRVSMAVTVVGCDGDLNCWRLSRHTCPCLVRPGQVVR